MNDARPCYDERTGETNRMALPDTRSCVICYQPLPPKSKMIVAAVMPEEADRYGWTGQKNADQTINVDMCLSCQMVRSSQAKGATQS